MADRQSPPRIFSPSRRQAGLARARQRQGRRDAARYILDDMVDDVIDRLEFMRFNPARALVVGDLTGTLTPSLEAKGVEVNERTAEDFDEEQPISGGPFDLIASLASLDRVNDLPGALLHAHAALGEGGIFIASVVGAGSLGNLRRAMIAAEPEKPAARMHPLIDTPSASALMQRAGFRRQVVDSHAVTVRYSSMTKLVSDLRDQGLNSALRDRAPPLGKAAMNRASEAFARAADAYGRVQETFEILTLTGWKG
ncbi:methyltransferase domain-containing protein [Erythrobacter litoralis]|uniref:methyltransferase domain-containing protein n=1 Tax=Erythrobacter litoralis TaxID=39960 RepID=UPI002435206B|nr:methyltransferase domain-containing protein [Erythrobacter litoralis]MDG6079550.1 methyltransferase domain-containing protein [Erythrobacter litoralis]